MVKLLSVVLAKTFSRSAATVASIVVMATGGISLVIGFGLVTLISVMHIVLENTISIFKSKATKVRIV